MRVDFHPAALSEAEEAQAWYAERSLIAAASFLRELSVAVRRAAEAPRRYPSGPAATRRVVLDRYPFTVVYRPTDDGIMVIAVAHQRRRPNYWKSR